MLFWKQGEEGGDESDYLINPNPILVFELNSPFNITESRFSAGYDDGDDDEPEDEQLEQLEQPGI